MCAPTNTEIIYKLPHVPFPKTDVMVDIGTIEHPRCNIKKRSFSEIVKTALFCTSIFMVFILRGNNSVVDPLVRLSHQLESLDRLKKEFVDDELELSWDRQHIAELQSNIDSMKSSFGNLRKQFHQEEASLIQKNESFREAIASTTELHSSVQKLDRDVFLQLASQVEKAHMELDQEMAENAKLKKLLADTIDEMNRQNIPIPEVALRGSFKTA